MSKLPSSFIIHHLFLMITARMGNRMVMDKSELSPDLPRNTGGLSRKYGKINICKKIRFELKGTPYY
jgi:hypothetical protein